MNFKYLAPAVLAVACTSCSTGMDAMVSTMQDAFRGSAKSSNPRLNADYRYLRVAIKDRVVFLALGDQDKDALGTVEVWYSSNREVLRLLNGRIAGATGLITEWRAVRLNEAPSWRSVLSATQPLQWTRVRDVMPGYRFGVRDQLELRAISPQNVVLQGYDAQRLHWFDERIVRPAQATRMSTNVVQNLPPARYAVDFQGDTAVVVYSEQCLAPDLCFAWQLWKP